MQIWMQVCSRELTSMVEQDRHTQQVRVQGIQVHSSVQQYINSNCATVSRLHPRLQGRLLSRCQGLGIRVWHGLGAFDAHVNHSICTLHNHITPMRTYLP